MRTRGTIILVTVLFSLAVSVSGQDVYTPERGSKVRKEIVEALRVPVEKELRQDIIFIVNELNVSGNWAFFQAIPQKPGGGLPDFRGTEYQEAIDGEYFDNNVNSLLKRTGGKWKVVTYQIGCTDVCYALWWKEHKAPKSIFPYTEDE